MNAVDPPILPIGEPATAAVAAVAPLRFDAFISYSRRDSDFAGRLHRALERYSAPPGLGRPPGRLRVFRDTADFTGSEYFAAIEAHLAQSQRLIVICSPAAAASTYVDDEIARFVSLHGAGGIVPVLWQGLPNNEATLEQANERAFPPALAKALAMPLAADFRTAVTGRVDAEAHRSAWHLLLANLLGVSRAEIEQRELKRRRALRRNWSLAIGTIFAALLALTVWALFEGERALARQLAAQASIRGGLEAGEVAQRVRIAREAVLRQRRLGEPTLEADTALRDALSHAPRRLLALPPGPARLTAFSVNGDYLIAAQGRELQVHALQGTGAAHRVGLDRPLVQLIVAAGSGTVAGLDDAGALHAWSWPALEPLPQRPPELAGAPVACIAFAGSTLAALRVRAGDRAEARPTLELMSWDPGAVALESRAESRLPARMQAPADRGVCVTASSTGSAIAGVLHAPTSDGAEPSMLAWRWSFEKNMFVKLPTAPIVVWPGVRAVALDDGGRPVLWHGDGRIERPSLLPGERPNVVDRLPTLSALSADASRGLVMAHIHDIIVPLFKPTRIDLVDTATGRTLLSVGDHAGLAAFATDAARFATMSGARIRLWDSHDGRETLRLQAAAPVQALRFDAASQRLAAVGEDGSVDVFAIGAADELQRLPAGATNVIVRSGPNDVPLVGGRRQIVWPAAGVALPMAQTIDEGHIHTIDGSPDGRFVVVGTSPDNAPFTIGPPRGGTLLLYEATPQGPVLRHRGAWGEYRFDAGSGRLLVAAAAGELRLIEASSGRVAWTRRIVPVEPPPAAALTGWRVPLAFADDGSVVATASAGGMMLVGGSDGRVLREEGLAFTGPLALSADGSLLARLSADSHVEVVRVVRADGSVTSAGSAQGAQDAGAAVARFKLAEVGSLRALIFSPQARLLLAVGGTSFSTFMSGGHFAEERLIVWDIARGERVARIPASARQLDDYQAQIGAQGDEAQAVAGLVWNPLTREIAGTVFPSLLAYYTVPSSMVRGTLTSWRLGDDGLVQTYRAASAESLTARAFAPGGCAACQRRRRRAAHDRHRRVEPGRNQLPCGAGRTGRRARRCGSRRAAVRHAVPVSGFSPTPPGTVGGGRSALRFAATAVREAPDSRPVNPGRSSTRCRERPAAVQGTLRKRRPGIVTGMDDDRAHHDTRLAGPASEACRFDLALVKACNLAAARHPLTERSL